MRKPFIKAALALSGFSMFLSDAMGSILSVEPEQSRVGLFEMVEYQIVTTESWDNPYRSREIALDLVWNDPEGREIVVPCFFDSALTGGQSLWKARFAPVVTGLHKGRFVVKQQGTQSVSDEVHLEVTHSAERGFLRAAGMWTLKFDNGESFRGIGSNFGWESRNEDDSRYFRELHENPRFNYEYFLGQLTSNGGNFFRTWMCAWNLPLEWKHVIHTARYSADSHPYNRGAMRRMDQLVELCEELGAYMMLTLDHAGSYLNDQWLINSYHRNNGGPVELASDFFTDPVAKQQYKDRLRYIVARWGYSPSIAVIEFFNEVDHVAFDAKDPVSAEVITAWHAEMSAYLRAVDPYGHLISTSISHREIAGLNDIKTIDINQHHIYGRTYSIPESLHTLSELHNKPYVIGEFGYEWDWQKNFNDFAELKDRDYRHGLYLGLFAPTPILPMTWWWEFFDERGMMRYYAPVAALNRRMLAAGGGAFKPLKADAGEMPAYAVICGDEVFVYVITYGKDFAAVDLRMPVDKGAFNVISLDTRTGVEGIGRILHVVDGRLALPSVSADSGDDLVFWLKPVAAE